MRTKRLGLTTAQRTTLFALARGVTIHSNHKGSKLLDNGFSTTRLDPRTFAVLKRKRLVELYFVRRRFSRYRISDAGDKWLRDWKAANPDA